MAGRGCPGAARGGGLEPNVQGRRPRGREPGWAGIPRDGIKAGAQGGAGVEQGGAVLRRRSQAGFQNCFCISIEARGHQKARDRVFQESRREKALGQKRRGGTPRAARIFRAAKFKFQNHRGAKHRPQIKREAQNARKSGFRGGGRGPGPREVLSNRGRGKKTRAARDFESAREFQPGM